jgi:hypothetical protein
MVSEELPFAETEITIYLFSLSRPFLEDGLLHEE